MNEAEIKTEAEVVAMSVLNSVGGGDWVATAYKQAAREIAALVTRAVAEQRDIEQKLVASVNAWQEQAQELRAQLAEREAECQRLRNGLRELRDSQESDLGEFSKLVTRKAGELLCPERQKQ